jgi:ACS family sodium-dependent inorganic phosphate cotransporter
MWMSYVPCSVLKLDLAAMGPLKTLPYLVMFLMSNAGGWLGDALILKHQKTVAVARKLVNSIGKAALSVQCIGGAIWQKLSHPLLIHIILADDRATNAENTC